MDLVNAASNLTLTELGSAITHISLHTAYPGTSGSSEVAGGSPAYTREAVTWGAPSAGSMSATGALEFDVPAGTTVAWAGFWSASTAGTFYGSVPLGPVGDPKITMATTADVFTAISHGWSDGQPVALSKTLGALPVGVTDGGLYYVRDVSGDTFKVASTLGGSPVDVTAAGTALIRAITVETFGGHGTYTITSLSLNQA